MSTLRIETPRAFLPLLSPARYKGAHGGRGSGKSHYFAGLAVEEVYTEAKRIVCIREVQETIKDSVKSLVEAKIAQYGLLDSFELLAAETRCRNGGLIVYKGMQTYNAQNIKSLEDFDVAWVEEAQTLSAVSLRMLRPTIRNPGSQLWFGWNPRHETDPVDEFLRGPKRPKSATVIQVNYTENPWFPDVLKDEKDEDYSNDPEMAEHVWGGDYEKVSEGAYYAKLIFKAEQEGRVGSFPYNPAHPVFTAWDLGVDDYTAIWFLQEYGGQVYVIDYYEVGNEGAPEVVRAALPELNKDIAEGKAQLHEMGRDEPFTYRNHFLPHDVRVREWGGGARSREDVLKELGVRPIHVGVAQKPADRVSAVRAILPNCHFNQNAGVKLGLRRLRRYSRKWNESLGSFTTPLHDENSHGADAFGEFAVNCSLTRIQQEKTISRRRAYDDDDDEYEADSWKTV